VGQRRIKKALSAAFRALGYDVRTRRPPTWGDDAFLDQARWLGASPVRVVVDVGANVGDTVAHYLAQFPGASIYAFEPFPDVHRQLAARFAGEPRVHPRRAAVSDSAGTRRFYVNAGDKTNSLLRLNPSAVGWAGAPSAAGLDNSIEVPAITLDEFCAAESIDRIDVLKMDIQGGEGMALEGASGLLARHAVGVIYLEVTFAPLYEGQAYFCDITRILNRHGYRVAALYNVAGGDLGLGWGEAIFRVF
jgi:FkbM family methyltransferase